MKAARLFIILATWIAFAFASPAWATNGMNLEGYGPVAMGMGGASLAYDNGTAALMNNPATLGLLSQGNARLDVALGMIGPDITSTTPGAPAADSSAEAFYMPAFGYARRGGEFVYGLGLFAQGGMGTQYGASSFLALGTGEEVRSEVSVGRLLAPLVYKVNSSLYVGGTVDFVWAGIDLKAAFNEAQIRQLAQGGNVNATGGLGAALGGFLTDAEPNGFVARFDFSNDSDYTGEAFGTGYGLKLGLVYLPAETLQVGVTYHSKTWLNDLKDGASMRIYPDGGDAMPGFADSTSPLQTFTGDIAIKDFQWPALFGMGVAWRPNTDWLVAADLKRIYWKDVLDKFTMTFTPNETTGDITVSLPQDWDDQTVLSVGAAYRATAAVTVRAGYNAANNPVPDKFMNLLFPAVVEKHATVGAGYTFANASELNFALSRAFAVEQTNPGDPSNGVPPTTVEHSQLNWQVMYSMFF